MTAEIIAGDALDEMSRLPGGEFQAVLTDPPYCSGARGESDKIRGGRSSLRETPDEDWFDGDSMAVDAYQWFLRQCALEWNRLLAVGGSVLVFTDWRMQNYVRQSIESVGFATRNTIVWDKGSFGMGNGFRHQHEFILHFTKGSFDPKELDTGNILRYSRPSETEHPTQKPVPLLSDLLRVVAERGDQILDPFAGSGSAGIGAIDQGMSFTGIERDPEYVGIARRRLESAEAQQRLRFVEAIEERGDGR